MLAVAEHPTCLPLFALACCRVQHMPASAGCTGCCNDLQLCNESVAQTRIKPTQVDLEAWFPASQTYRELVSGSNCTDYQVPMLVFKH
jgi:hypothetical protein